ncbi:MAG: hypothetical protein ABI823_15755 [Bryobacteraceae bacterium]
MKLFPFATAVLFLAIPLARPTVLKAAENSRLVIQTRGQFEDANTVVYNIYLATKDEALTDLQVSTAVPGATRFLENVETPATARYQGVYDNVVRWTVPAIDRETLLGPFTVRIRVDGSRTDIPAAPGVWASCPADRCEFLLDPGDGTRLKAIPDTSSVTFDQRGTLNAQNANGLVAIGDTGGYLHIPEGAVDRKVTVTFKRLAVEDDKVPQSAKDSWWCSLYQITVEPNIAFSKPIVYAFPARRGLTPGLAVRAFSSADGKTWQEATAPPASNGAKSDGRFPGGFGQFGGGFATCTTVPFGFTTCSSLGGFGVGQFGAFGVDQSLRLTGSITGTSLTTQFGVPFKPAQISDGTSNIIAILIGIR